MRLARCLHPLLVAVAAVSISGCTSDGDLGPAPTQSTTIDTTSGTITGVLNHVMGLVRRPSSGVLTLVSVGGGRTQVTVPPGGRFVVAVKPGRYTLTGKDDCERINVVVERGKISRANVQCGIGTT